MIEREIIKKIKKKNGNIKFNQKDLLWYLVHKVDKIDDKLNIGEGKIAVNKSRIKTLYWILGISIPLIITLIVALSGFI